MNAPSAEGLTASDGHQGDCDGAHRVVVSHTKQLPAPQARPPVPPGPAWGIFLMLLSCSAPCYPEVDYPNYTDYSRGDPAPGAQKVIDSVLDCLAPLKTQWLSPEEAQEAQCYGQPVLEQRACLQVLVAPDWYTSTCTGEQVFPCQVGPQRCEEKGQEPTQSCPCACRAQIQDEGTIYVTPNMKLLPAYLVTLFTSCRNPWTPSLLPCSRSP